MNWVQFFHRNESERQVSWNDQLDHPIKQIWIFFFWGCLKLKVFKAKSNNVNNLKERIRAEIRNFTPYTLDNVKKEFINSQWTNF